MRIAIVSEGFRPYVGGVETRYTKLAERLSRRHDVDVITLLHDIHASEDEVPAEESCGRLRVFRIRVDGKYFLRDGTRSLSGVKEFSRRCVESLRKNDYDVVLVSEWPLLHILYLRKRTDHRMIVDWHEVWGKYYWKFGIKGLGGYILEKIVAGLRGIKHVAVSDFTRNRLKKILRVHGDVPVIWNGVDLDEYGEISAVKREFGKIVFFGRFAPHKGIELLIDAFKIVRRSRPEATLHIIGDGPLRDRVTFTASKVDGVQVHLAIPRKKLLEHIKSAWVAAIPSSREGQGISYFEAMAAGTPVIAARSPYNAFSSMARDGEDALIVERERSALAKGILRLLKDEHLWRRLSENGKKFAFRFTWDEIILKLEKVLKDVEESS